MNVQHPGIFVNRSSNDKSVTAEAEQRFWAKVRKGEGCWEWIASRNSNGYGQFGLNGQNAVAHRVSWVMHNGPIPDGMFVLHRCDNRGCVRPDHLFLGTAADNARDRNAKGRTATGANGRYPTGIAHHNAILNDEQVRAIRAEYVPRKVGYATIGKRYGVSKELVRFIVKGQRREGVAA